MSENAKICVGVISGAFGVRGDIRLKSFCGDPAAIADYGPLMSEDGRRTFDITITGTTKSGLTARLAGVEAREAADDLRGVRLFALRDSLPHLPDDEFYHADLIGLAVHDTGGALIGHVQTVQNHGATDLLELRVAGKSETVLLPFTHETVPTVDLTAGRIVADLPDGLLP